MAFKLRPTMGNVLVLMDEPESKSGAIHIPEISQARAQNAKVLKLGIWRVNRAGNLIPYPVKPGDKVLVDARSGRWLHGEKERLKLVEAERILAVYGE